MFLSFAKYIETNAFFSAEYFSMLLSKPRLDFVSLVNKHCSCFFSRSSNNSIRWYQPHTADFVWENYSFVIKTNISGMENSFLFEFHIEFTFAHHAVCKWQPMMMMFASTLYYVVHEVMDKQFSFPLPSRTHAELFIIISIFSIFSTSTEPSEGSHVCTLSASVHELPSKVRKKS